MVTLGPERVWGTLDATCLVIKKPQIVMHEADQPDFVSDFFDANILTSKNLAQVDLTPSDANPATGGDGDGAIVKRVLQVG